jgi:hypothetical protein
MGTTVACTESLVESFCDSDRDPMRVSMRGGHIGRDRLTAGTGVADLVPQQTGRSGDSLGFRVAKGEQIREGQRMRHEVTASATSQ